MDERSRLIFAQHSARWDEVADHPEATLIRMAVLRDLIRAIHAEKSVFLARGDRSSAQRLSSLEARVTELRTAVKLEGSLLEKVEGTAPPARTRTRMIPEALLNVIPREKFERYDREWEAIIAAEAATQSWRFWRLDACIEIPHAENWNELISERIRPHGLVLFVESRDDASGFRENAWQASWYIVLHPRFITPDFRIAEIPGTVTDIAPPRWNLLYSPRSN